QEVLELLLLLLAARGREQGGRGLEPRAGRASCQAFDAEELALLSDDAEDRLEVEGDAPFGADEVEDGGHRPKGKRSFARVKGLEESPRERGLSDDRVTKIKLSRLW